MLVLLPITLYLIVTNGKPGEPGKYFNFYNQSVFSISDRYPRCTVTAKYNTGGRIKTQLYNGLSRFDIQGSSPNQYFEYKGCEWEETEYESQQEFDLEYYELLKVCPTLTYLDPQYISAPDSTGYPANLIWPRDNQLCSNCPRFACDNSTTSGYYDTEYNKSFAYHSITNIYFESYALSKTCYHCECQRFTAAQDSPWAWRCDLTNYNTPPYLYNSPRWVWYPLGNGNSRPYYPPFNPNGTTATDVVCGPVSNSPTPAPTDNPITVPTKNPTLNPSAAPTADARCFDVDGRQKTQGDYFWNADETTNCTNLRWCKCKTAANGTGVERCLSDWKAIMNDEELYYGWMTDVDGCGGGRASNIVGQNAEQQRNYLTTCYTQEAADRLFTFRNYGQNPGWCNLNFANRLCPRCGCTADPFTPSPSTNTSFNTTLFRKLINTSDALSYADRLKDSNTLKNCAECSCVQENTQVGFVSYVKPETCVFYDVSGNEETADCIYNPRKCYSNSGEYDPNTAPVTCTNQRVGGLGDYNTGCSFTRFSLEKSTPDNVCVEWEQEVEGSWGCASTTDCDVLGGPDCYSASFDYNVYAYDCVNDVFLKDTYSADLTLSCCNDEFNCNNKTIEAYLEGGCTTSDPLGEYYKFGKECSNSQRNLYELTEDTRLIRAAFCNDNLDYQSFADDTQTGKSYCDLLKVYWQYNTFCECNQARLDIARLRNAKDQQYPVEDTDELINLYESGFWARSKYEPHIGATRSYGAIRDNLKVMYDYWMCAQHEEDKESVADTFFDCNLTAPVETIKNRDTDSAAMRHINVNILNIFGIIFGIFIYNKHINLSLIILLFGIYSIGMVSSLTTNPIKSLENMNWVNMRSGPLGECRYKGTKYTTGFTQSSSSDLCETVEHEEYAYQDEAALTWDKLRSACPKVEYAGCYTESENIGMDNLVWSKVSGGCFHCPRCPCSNETDTVRHFIRNEYKVDTLSQTSSDWMIKRYCYKCTCEYWAAAEQWAWSCEDSAIATETDDDLVVNGTDKFCVADPAKPALTGDISCIWGTPPSYLNPTTKPLYGRYGYSHCGWLNTTIERYDNAEPAVCANDDIFNTDPTDQSESNGNTQGWLNSLGYPSYFISSNNEPICLSIAGDSTGCYYTSFDFDVSDYDCVIDDYVSDTYSMKSTIFCCNDGPYCNNQTIIDATTMIDGTRPSVTYVNGTNVSLTVECQESNVLKEWLLNIAECPNNLKALGVDQDFTKAIKCYGGYSYNKPDCDTVDTIWKYYTHCACKKSTFYRDNTNQTYTDYVESEWTSDYSTSTPNSAWSRYDCGDAGDRFKCSHGNKLNFKQNAIFIIIAILYQLFIQ